MKQNIVVLWLLLALCCFGVAQAGWTNITMYQSFDTGYVTATQALTSSGLYNGTLVNTPTNITGKLDTALFFNASKSQRINTSVSLTPTGTAWTYGAWIQPGAVVNSSEYAIMGAVGGAGNSGTFLSWSNSYYGTGYLVCGVNNVVNTAVPRYYYPNFNGSYYHVVCMENSTGMYMFLNGAMVASSVGATVAATSTATGYTIGGLNNAGFQTSNFTGGIDEAFIANVSFKTSDIVTWFNAGVGYNPFASATITPPNITFVASLPPDINTTNVIVSGVNLTYTYTNGSAVLWNFSQLYVKTGINDTVDISQGYVNGTKLSGYINTNATLFNGANVTFSVTDNQILFATYNMNETLMESLTHVNVTLTTQASAPHQRFLKTRLDNISPYGPSSVFLELMTNNTVNDGLLTTVLYCNSTYTTGNPNTHASCTPLSTITTVNYSHRHNSNSAHIVATIGLNTTTGKIGTVQVTPRSYILVASRVAPSGSDVVVWGVNATVDTALVQYSNDRGSSWTTVNNFVTDLHVHQYNASHALVYQGCGILTNGTEVCDTLRSDVLELGDVPPSSVVFTAPTASTVTNNTVYIAWDVATVLAPAVVANYSNMKLYSSSGYVNDILATNALNTNYTWTIPTNITSGLYHIYLETWTNYGRLSQSLSPSFAIDRTPPSCTGLGNASYVINTTQVVSCSDTYSALTQQNTTCSNGQVLLANGDIQLNITPTIQCNTTVSDAFATTTYATTFTQTTYQSPSCSVVSNESIHYLQSGETNVTFGITYSCQTNTTNMTNISLSCTNGFVNTTTFLGTSYNATNAVQLYMTTTSYSNLDQNNPNAFKPEVQSTSMVCTVTAWTVGSQGSASTTVSETTSGLFTIGRCPLSRDDVERKTFMFVYGAMFVVFCLSFIPAFMAKKHSLAGIVLSFIGVLFGFACATSMVYMHWVLYACITTGSLLWIGNTVMLVGLGIAVIARMLLW